MKFLILLMSVFILNYGHAQTTALVEPKSSRDLDIVLIPFGMEHAIKMGELDQSGKATLSGSPDFTQVPKPVQNEYVLKMSEVLEFCDNFNDLLNKTENIAAVETDPLFLMDQGQMAGFIMFVSGVEVFNWIVDEENNNPTIGSYFELVYVESGFNFSGNCVQTNDTEEEEAQTQFVLSLNLKPGLNYIEYNIQSIDQTNSQNGTSFPERVSVTAHQKLPDNVIWIAHYY